MTNLTEWKQAEKLFFAELSRLQERAERHHQDVITNAKRILKQAGMPTTGPYQLYLHNAIVDIKSNRLSGWAKGMTRDQISMVKKADHILGRQWEASRLVRKWSEKNNPHPHFNPCAFTYWVERAKLDTD